MRRRLRWLWLLPAALLAAVLVAPRLLLPRPLHHRYQLVRNQVHRNAADLVVRFEEFRSGRRHALLRRGNPHLPEVALTFDDGPHPDFTPRLLAALDRLGVKASFFVVGMMAEKHPELILAQHRAGHVVANHGYNHSNLAKLDPPGILRQWTRGNDIVSAITGVPVRFCRPPGGDYNLDVIAGAEAAGLVTVLWTDAPGDYALRGARSLDERALRGVGQGAILLLHDGVEATLESLPRLVEILRGRGFRFVTVEELAAHAGLAPPPAADLPAPQGAQPWLMPSPP